MRQRDHVVPRSRSRALRVGVLSVIAALTLTGCEHGQFVNGFLPQGVTEGADRVTTLWVWSWIALVAIGDAASSFVDQLTANDAYHTATAPGPPSQLY